VDVNLVTTVHLRNAVSLDPLWQRFEAILASPSSCGMPPTKPSSRTIAHQPYDPMNPDAAPALWPASSILRAAVQIRGGPFVDRTPFDAGDETALLIAGGGSWDVQDGLLGPNADTGAVTSLAIFGDAAWRTFHIIASFDPKGGACGVAAAVSANGNTATLWIIDEGSRQLRVLRRQAGLDTEVGTAALPAGVAAPYTLEVSGYEDGWEASVGETKLKTARDLSEQGRLAMSVHGAGGFTSLRVEALDLYRFEFLTSRFADFAAHLGSFSGKADNLLEVAPATATPADLVAATPVADLMRAASDPAARQRAFDHWVSSLGIPLRTQMERVFISSRENVMLIESPEPLPISEDVTLETALVSGDESTAVPVTILTDGAECRVLLVPALGTFAPGEYEITWKLTRSRFRAASSDTQNMLSASATTAFKL
jgi:hypothetical protein